MAFSGSLEKMTIKGFTDPGCTQKSPAPNEMSVFINPAAYSHTFKICYNSRQAQGANGGSPDFNRIPSEVLKFELVFDGTGVVPSPLPGVAPFMDDGIKDQVETFTSVVFDYKGKIHSPNYLIVSWGTLRFKCRLSELAINYTLFKPDGTPLRARANATFVSFNAEDELARMANASSPDLSHVVTVKGGDTLPLLCYGIYGSSAYYLEVARVNRLENFRDLVPGTQLMFPPLQNAVT